MLKEFRFLLSHSNFEINGFSIWSWDSLIFMRNNKYMKIQIIRTIVFVRVHKGLTVYYLKMAHCGDLTNKGWRHSGHITLVASCFFLKAISYVSLLVPASQDYLITWLWDPSDYVITRPQLRAKDKLRPLPLGHNFPSIGYKKGWLQR